MSAEKIQALRKELVSMIEHKVKPLKRKLEELLIAEAVRLCPFSIGDIITLDNGKLGKITTIKYKSLDYGFQEDEEDLYSFFPKDVTDIEYRFAYEIDDRKFSITWSISGFRMIQNNTKPGLTRFVDINPAYYLIDKENNSVRRKNLDSYLTNIDDLLSISKL